MNLHKDIVLGIYISGSHITTALVDLEKKEILDKSYYRSRVNSWASCDNIIDSWTTSMKNSLLNADLKDLKIGIAVPGQFDYHNGISYIKGNKKYDSLYGVNVKNKLAQKLEISSENIRMVNDASAFLHGELLVGSVNASNKVIALTLGTGLGTSVCDHGIVRDAELWNSFFLEGRAENYISTRWLLGRYFELTGLNIMSVKSLNKIHGESATVKSIFKEFAYNLGLLLKQFVEEEHPEMIIMGGDITIASSRFLPHVQRFLQQNKINTPITISSLGNHAEIFGAATCWL